MLKQTLALGIIAAALMTTQAAQAQTVKIGLSATITGPNSGIGMAHRQTSEIFPKTLGGLPVQWIILDDATDPVTATKNARKLVEEEKVDAIMGSSSTLTAATMMDVAVGSGTPQIALVPVPVAQNKFPWVFQVAQPLELMIAGVAEDMKRKGVKRIGYIGFSDGWGDQTLQALTANAKKYGFEISTQERYARTDTSVSAQALRLASARPDAIFVGASGTASALPHIALKDIGYAGPIYHTHGAVSNSFIQTGGSAVEGALMTASPIVVYEELAANDPVKAAAADLVKKFQTRWGNVIVQPFSAYSWDAALLLDRAVAEARKTAVPGTPQFRTALRDALQNGKEVAGASGVYKFTSADHTGVDGRSRVLVVVKDGKFRLVK